MYMVKGTGMDNLIKAVEQQLLPRLDIESVHPHEPVKVKYCPPGWKLLGAGNYAAVLVHPENSEVVVKVYAPGRPGLEDEVEVYRRLGEHPAYSQCYHAGGNYLMLKRMRGVTLYNCIMKGIRIPDKAIRDIDKALDYARGRGLHPHDIHGKNVMLHNGRGSVLDVSDFLKVEQCTMWEDLKEAYYRYYVPYLQKWPLPVPGFMMNWIRKGYRKYKKKH
ncbi:serine/threonine protein kinase [Paenibacillus gansuensis]|uniref:Serine/threonine protein kinase n=1 Tax=Paenibacillus gansuensis TaxID=306542 RepID=A0ABW5PJI3_9BACL